MKVLGKDIKTFFSVDCDWEALIGDGVSDLYMYDGQQVFDEVETYCDSKLYTLNNGSICSDSLSHDNYSISVHQLFKIWQKTQKTATLVVTVPKEDVDNFKEYAGVRGWLPA